MDNENESTSNNTNQELNQDYATIANNLSKLQHEIQKFTEINETIIQSSTNYTGLTSIFNSYKSSLAGVDNINNNSGKDGDNSDYDSGGNGKVPSSNKGTGRRKDESKFQSYNKNDDDEIILL